MGNAESSASTGTVPSTDKIKQRSGNKASCIPSPQIRDAATYEKIIKHGDFKDFMYQHLDSDYLIDAILQGAGDDADGERQLLEGISMLNVVNNSDVRNEYIQNINNYQNLVESGINLKIKDSLSHVEKELDVRSTYKSNLFIKSFHKRLAALKSIEDCIVNEKMIAIEHKKRRQYAFNHLNSVSYPQLIAVEGLMRTGLLLLQQFPVFYPLLSSNTNCVPLLTRPIIELCDNFIKLNNLDLYSAWAPAPKSPMKQIRLKKSTAAASSGTAADAIDNVPTTCWSSSKPRSTWSVQLEEPSTISAIRIAWAPTSMTGQPQSAGFAPKKITLKIRESSDESAYISVLVVDPVVEWKRQGTWNQVYQVNRINVAAIQVFCAKYCQYNTSSTIKMYDFEVLVDDKDAKWVNTADLLVNLQVSLLPILEFDVMWPIVSDSLLSLIRSSGSLSLTLRLLKYLYENEKALDMKAKSHKSSGENQILQLIKAYQIENSKVIEGISTFHSSINKLRKDVVFDAVTKTAGVTLSEDNMVTTIQSTFPSIQYCLFNTCMDKGLWEWEVVVTQDMLNDESTCLGVAKIAISNNNYENSSDMWVVRCMDGELYHDGRSKNEPIIPVHVDDICRFTYDSEAMTLSMSVNNIEQGVIFERVPTAVAPLVLFYGSNNGVKIVSVSHRDSPKRELPPDFDKFAVSFPTIDPTVALSNSGPTIVETILQHVSALAATRMYQIEYASTDTGISPDDAVSLQSLEYPYCIELGIGTIKLLTSLLQLFIQDMKNYRNKNLIMYCLQLLDAHFIVLNYTNLDIVDVGFKYKLDDGKILFDLDCAIVVRELFQVLKELRQSGGDIDMRVAACKAFARGSSIFLPNGYDKIDLCVSIINESLDRNSTLDEATSVLLEMLVQTLSQYEQIIKIIEIYKGFESSRQTIQNLLTYLLSLISGYTIEKLVDTGVDTLTVMKHEKFRKTVVTLFVRLQEQLVHHLLSSKQDSVSNVIQDLFILYSKKVISAAIPVFDAAHSSTEDNGIAHSIAESYLRDSMIMHILQPLVHSFCFFTAHFPILQGILPSLVYLLQRLSDLCKKSKRCMHSIQLLYNTISSDVNKPPTVGVSGWKTIKAQFEDNQSSYSVSDNGTMYTSVHSNNTCGYVNTPFGKKSRAAWEFQLESDTINDECSVFGAARIPDYPGVLNRCYSTSPDLWMRRAYNGYMYVQGRATGNNMEKIHPSDIVRVEFDGKAGTLSFSVNGSEPEVGFTDISETIYPACGSYRANVAIKLLKVEVFSSDESDSVVSASPNTKSQWNLDPERMNCRDSTILVPLKSDKVSAADAIEKSSWVTARTNDGATDGVHEWTFEVLENSKNPFALGLVSDNPYSKDRLAGPCYEDMPEKGTDSFDVNTLIAPAILPVEASATEAPSMEQLGDSQLAVSNTSSPLITTKSKKMPPRKKVFLYNDNFVAISWNSDGSLWVNGVRRSTDFGKKYLPLSPFTSVAIRIDRFEHTVSYLVNGALVGVAFGPESSGAKVVVAFSTFNKLYPAASVSTFKQSIKVKQTGTNGSLVLPIQILMQKACSATIGRLISVLACGPVVDKQESLLMPLLQSPLLIGGIDDTSIVGAAQSPGMTWDGVWNEFSIGDSAESLSLQLPKPNADSSLFSSLQVFLNDIAVCKGAIADGSYVFLLLNWLENIDKEPLFLRQAMEKIGSYSFPVCEMPILACLLKHSGLIVEAMECCDKLKVNETPAPSTNMVLLWKKMRQIRVNLRKERQRFKETINTASAEATVNTVTSITSINPVPVATTAAVTGIPVTVVIDSVPVVESRQLDIISAADMQIPIGVFLSEHIIWRTQTPDTTSIYSPTYQCDVLAVGIDFLNEYLFIRFCIRGDMSMGDLQSPSDSTLHVNDSQVDDSDQNIARQTPTESPREILGTLRYDMSNVPDFGANINSATVQFEYGSGGYIPVTLQLPLNSVASLHASPEVSDETSGAASARVIPDKYPDSNASPQDDAPAAPSSFEEYCALLGSRAQFLLNIYPSENYFDSSSSCSKDLILDLLDRFTSNVGTPLSSSQSQSSKRNSSFKLVRMKSHDGTERWGRVLEFVKGNSKLRRQLSNSNYPSNNITDGAATGETDDLIAEGAVSPVVAAIQACSLFIILTEKFISSTTLTSVMTKRAARASYRIFAFDALYTILKYVNISTNPLLLEDQFLFLRQALRDSTAYAKPDAAVLNNKDHKSHYLVNLEGCNGAMLACVQKSFLKVFSVVSNVTSQYLSTWDTLSTSNCYGCLLAEGGATTSSASINAINVHSVEKTLINEINAPDSKILVPPLRLMLSIWSLNFSTRDCLFLLKCGILPSLHRLTSFATLEKVTQTWYDVAEKLASVGTNYGHKPRKCYLWSNDYVVEGLKSGTLSCRAVLLHLYLIPRNVLTTSERVAFGLDRNFKDLCINLGVSKVSLLYQRIWLVVQKKNKDIQKDESLKKQKLADAASKIESEVTIQMAACGSFDPLHSSRGIALSDRNLLATFGNDEDETACAIATVVYDCDIGATDSGNYFEVEFLSESIQGEISIGLCDRSSFSADGFSPGPIPFTPTIGFYTYNAITGARVSMGGVTNGWPASETGDIIGCGYAMDRSAIFFTRNGTLLGDAFTLVRERILHPVVVFGSGGSSTEIARINFGVHPFRYNSADVHVPSSVANVLAAQENAKKHIALIELEGSVSNRVAIDSEEDKEHLRKQIEKYTRNLESCEAYIHQYHSLRLYSITLLKYFTLLACKVNEMHGDEKKLMEDYASNENKLLAPKLVRGVSTYGTPKKATTIDGTILEENLIKMFTEYFVLGSNHFLQSPEKSGVNDADLTISRSINSFSSCSGDAAGNNNSRAVEPLEIENCVHETLVLLNSVMGPSLMFKRHFLNPVSLNSLLLVLYYGSVRTRRLVVNLLMQLLPTLTPDDTENMLSDEWKGLISSMNIGAQNDSTARRQRRMPDSIIKLLMYGVRRAVAVQQDGSNIGILCNSGGIDALKEPIIGLLPYGYGNNILVSADQNIALIQKLFASPTWTELIACNITDTLRVAREKIELFNVDPNVSLDCDLLLNAAAACAVLSGFEIIRQGCKITTEDNAVGYVVSTNYFNQTVQVVLADSLAVSNYGTETINNSKIKPKMEAIDVDLSQLSQPLLSNFTVLIKELLLWFTTVGSKLMTSSATNTYKTSISHHTTNSSLTATSSVDKCLFRLNCVASTTLSSLLEHQGDFCLESVDSDIVQSIIAISLLPTCMTYLPESSELTKVWNFVQSRKLERVVVETDDVLPNDSSIVTPSSPLARTADSDADPVGISRDPSSTIIDSTEVEEVGAIDIFLPYSSEYRICRQIAAKKLSLEFVLDENFCLQLLEYFMNDETATRAYLCTVKDVETTVGADVTLDITDDNVMLSKVVMSDENPLRNIDDPSIVWDSSGYDNFNTCSDFERELMRIVYKDSEVADSTVTTVNSTLLEYGSLLVESAIEGPSAISSGGKCGRCLHQGEVQNELVVSLYDESKGLPYCDLVQTSSMRLINSIYGQKQDTQSMSNFMSQLDMSLTILRTRGIASRLLLDGNVNLSQDADGLDSWLKLLKLITINDNSLINSTDTSNIVNKKGLKPLCNALLARAGNSVVDSSVDTKGNLESNMADILINDVVHGFKSLSHSSFSTLTRDSKMKDSYNFTFASPHPYISPLTTTGKIDIPSEWRGVLLTFSPKCSTASNLAKLNFYKSEKDYHSGNAMHSFWGDHFSSGGDNSFHSFTLTREALPTSLYYSFQALPGSEKPTLNMVSSHPLISVNKNSITAVIGGARGLGESDTLFNLFDETGMQPSDSPTTVSYNSIAECDGVTSGTWFFEVVVDTVSSTSEDMSLARVGLANLSSYHNEALHAPGIGTVAESMAVDLCGRFHLSMEGREEIVMMTDAYGSYFNGDVIGCLFNVSNHVLMLTFVKNGDWGNAFSRDVHLSTGERKFAPGVSITNNVVISYNYGQFPFKHPPDLGLSWQPFLARPTTIDNAVVAWGYQFSIQPLNDLYMKVNRDFTLITTLKAENSAGLPVNENIWIWRSKPTSEFCSCGDIITLSNRPPRGSIIFDKNQCKPASKFNKVFYSSKLAITVWRPVPPVGFVSLGDVVTTGSGSPLSEHLYCVPKFAVAECSVGKRIYCAKKGGETKLSSISLWSVGNQLGTFFASSSDQLQAGVGEDSFGVGKPYMLRYRHLGIISGEWSDELEVLSLPSLSWSFSLLNFLVDNNSIRSKALTTTVFSNIIQYIRSNASPAPLQGIPVLIKIIRSAQAEGILLPLDQISGLCAAIMHKAVGKVNSDKGSPVSDSLVRLLDLVVEVNSIQVINSNVNKSINDVASIASIPTFIELTDDSHKPLAMQLLPVQNTHWWDRSNLNPSKLDISRLISADKVDSLFTKDPILRRMKQVLNFFAAIGADRFKTSYSGLTQSYSYPRLMVAKLWYDNFSNCIVDESLHPYRHLVAKKKVSFPSASKLVITFDKRCSIGTNAALILEYVSNGSVVVETIKGVFGDDPKYSNGFVIPCSEFEVSFTVNEKDGRLDGEINPANDWGWAYLVTATGPIYESISNAIEFNSAMFSGISRYRDDISSGSVICHICAEPITKSTCCRSCLLHVHNLAAEKSTAEGAEIVDEARALPKEVELEVDKTSENKKESEKNRGSTDIKVPNDVKNDNACPATMVAVEDKLLMKYMQEVGLEVKEGTFVVPHASELEIMIERPNPKVYTDANNEDVDIAVIIRSKSSDDSSSDACTQVIKVPIVTDKSATITVVGDCFSYSIVVLPRSYVPGIIKSMHAQAGELLDAERIQSESMNIKDSTIDDSTPKADVKVESPDFISENMAEDPLMGEFWACNICTCFNPNYMDECSACMNPRSGDSHDSGAPGAGWWCQHCTFINPLSTSSCSMCSLPRGDDADAKAHNDDEMEPLPHEPTRSGGSYMHESISTSSHGLTRTDSRGGKSSSLDSDKGESYEKILLKKAASNSKSDMLIFTVKGKLSQQGKFETRLEGAVCSGGTIVTPYCIQADMNNWTHEADSKLLEYINTIVTASTSSTSAIFTKDNIYIPKQYYSFRGSSLLPMSLISVQARMFLLEAFNKCLEDILPILNTKNYDPCSIGSMVRKFNKYIFMNLKMPLLEKAIAATAVGSGAGVPATLTLDNFTALTSRDKNEKDPSTSNCCFVQAFRQLQKSDSAVYRHIFSTDRVFQITFNRESGIDAGGVFREGISRIIEDLFSENFNLLLLCPNGQHGIHTNLDKYVPNPQHTGPLAMQMFEFMGRLMGMSLRAKLCLPFELPSIIWKGVVGDEIILDDLREVDFLTVGLLEAVKNCEKDDIFDQEAFQAKYDDKLCFVYNGSDGVEREIRPGSGNRIVTYENRQEFCDSVLNNRLKEFEKPVSAIERGMSEVISTRVLQLFSWQQLEIIVAGNPIFDIDLWKSKTESHVSAKTLALFWKVMEGFTPKEQAGFVRFAWGRSRLPAPKDFTVKMRLTSAGSSALPQAHTCFFHVELPEYPTEDEMRHGLLTAIHYGVGGILNG